jgi:hypothetical protein
VARTVRWETLTRKANAELCVCLLFQRVTNIREVSMYFGVSLLGLILLVVLLVILF